MAEKWALIDAQKRPTGMIVERGVEPIPEGMYYMGVDVWVVRPDGRVLITQRDPRKVYGLLWECTGGAVIAGETYEQGAHRELLEETGINAPMGALEYLGDVMRRNCILSVFVYRAPTNDLTVTLQEGETIDFRWLTRAELEAGEDAIAPSIWSRYLQFREKIFQA